MTEQTQDKSTTTRRRSKFALFAVAISLLVVAVALIWYRSGSPSIDERLAAIEAARAIPDSENAAIQYERLLGDPRMGSLSEPLEFLDDEADGLTGLHAWSEENHQQLATWIDENQWLIDELLTISHYEKCRFPIDIDLETTLPSERASLIRKLAFFLRRSANVDVGDGRIDDAIAKWRCMIRIAAHLYQQPTSFDTLMGIILEQLSLVRLIVFIVEGDVDGDHLKEIGSLSLQTRDDWANVLTRIRSVEQLAEEQFKEQFSLIDRLKVKIRLARIVGMGDPLHEDLHLLYMRVLALKRGTHILIALRRHLNDHGDWPTSLDAMRPDVCPEILIDPFNRGDFVYRLTDDGFTLYSKGKNNFDEDGRCSSDSAKGPDDWPIWPPRGHKTQSQDAKSE